MRVAVILLLTACCADPPGPPSSPVDGGVCIEPPHCDEHTDCCSGACFENRCRARCRESLGESCPPGQQCRAVELEPGVLLREVCL